MRLRPMHHLSTRLPAAAVAFALCLTGVGPASAGPSVKKTTWTSWSETLRAVRTGWGLYATVAPAERRTPVCAAPLVPLLLSAEVAPTWVGGFGRRGSLPFDDLGTWRVEFRGNYSGNDPNRSPVHFRSENARGGATASVRFDGGMRWDAGEIFVTVSPLNGATGDVAFANFNVHLTATCGPDDVRLRVAGQ